MNGVVIDRPSKHIKDLSTQLKLQYLSGKIIVQALLLQRGDVAVDLINDLRDNDLLRIHIDAGLCEEPRQRIHGFQVVRDANFAHIVCQKACIVDCLHYGFTINLREVSCGLSRRCDSFCRCCICRGSCFMRRFCSVDRCSRACLHIRRLTCSGVLSSWRRYNRLLCSTLHLSVTGRLLRRIVAKSRQIKKCELVGIIGTSASGLPGRCGVCRP